MYWEAFNFCCQLCLLTGDGGRARAGARDLPAAGPGRRQADVRGRVATDRRRDGRTLQRNKAGQRRSRLLRHR